MVPPGTLTAEKMYLEIGRLYMEIAMMREIQQSMKPPVGQPAPAEIDKLKELSEVLKDSGIEPVPVEEPHSTTA